MISTNKNSRCAAEAILLPFLSRKQHTKSSFTTYLNSKDNKPKPQTETGKLDAQIISMGADSQQPWDGILKSNISHGPRTANHT